MPVDGDDEFIVKPTLNTRLLAGVGGDKTLEFKKTDIDYGKDMKSSNLTGTLEMSILASGDQTERKLEFVVPKGVYIGSYTGATDIRIGVTVTEKSNSDGSSTLLYTIAEGAEANFTITAGFSVLPDSSTSYIYPGQAFNCKVSYSAKDSDGTAKKVTVVETETRFTFRQVGEGQFVSIKSTFSAQPYISEEQIKAGFMYSKLVPLLYSYGSDLSRSTLTKDAPCISGFRVKLKPSNENIKITECIIADNSGKKHLGVTSEVSTRQEDGSYILTFKYNDARSMIKPTYNTSTSNPHFSFKIQNDNPVYGEEYTFEVQKYSMLVPTAEGHWSSEYEHTKWADWTLKARMRTAPEKDVVRLNGVNSILYIKNSAELKKIASSLPNIECIASTTAELEKFINPIVTIALPDGLAEETMLRISSYFNGGKIRVSYDDAVNWEDITPTKDSDYYKIPLTKNSGRLPTHVKLYDLWTQTHYGYLSISLQEGYGDTYRNGDAVKDGDVRPYTVTFTADNLDVPAVATSKMYYEEYVPPKKLNRIELVELGYNDSATGLSLSGDYWYNMDTVNLFCSTNKTNVYNGELRIRNSGNVENSIVHTNARILLKAEKYAELTEIRKVSSKQFVVESVKITLSNGDIFTIAETALPYTAGDNVTIASAEYLIKSLPLYADSDAVAIAYSYQLPASGIGKTEKEFSYFTLSFEGSDQAPKELDSPKFTVNRKAFRGMANVERKVPYSFRANGLSLSGDVTAGGTVNVEGSGNYCEIVRTKISGYVNKEKEATIKAAPFVIAMRVEKNFRYVGGSLTVKEASCSAQFKRGYFDNGDGLLRIFVDAPTAYVSPKFKLTANVDTPQNTYTPISDCWMGADFSAVAALDGQVVQADGLPECSVTYKYPGFKSETDIGVDINGDGELGDTAASAVLEVQSPRSIRVSALKQEGIFSYGSSTENQSEGQSIYYGSESDSFTYRTFVLAQQLGEFKSTVMYIPIPRKGVKPADNAAVNEWDAKLTGIDGKVKKSLDAGNSPYNLYYSTVQNPSMQELTSAGFDNGYTQYVTGATIDWSAVTMLKIKAESLPKDTADDLELTFSCKGKKPAGAFTNHMETYYVYKVVRAGSPDTNFAVGPTKSIAYTLAANSIAGTVFLDADYDGKMNILGTDDKPVVGLTVTLYDDKGQPVVGKTAITGVNGDYVIEAPNPGNYSIGVAPAPATQPNSDRKLIDKGASSVVDKETGMSAPLAVTRAGVQGQNIGYRDKRSFTLYKDAAHTLEIKEDDVVDLSVAGDMPIRYVLNMGYMKDLPGLLTVTSSVADKLTAIKGGENAFVFSLFGNAATEVDAPVVVTVAMSDGQGGTQTRSFKVRVLPPRVVAKFEDNMNFYATVEYDVARLAGGISYINSTDASETIKATGAVGVDKDGKKFDIEMTDKKTFGEGQIGIYHITYKGTDKYGRDILDENGKSTIVRNIFIHGYPYLTESAPLQRRMGEDFSAMRNQGGGYIEARHKHIYADKQTGGWHAEENETFSADPTKGQTITQLGFRAYAKDGTDFKENKLVEDLVNSPLLTTLPITAGAYEVHYSVRMADMAAILPLHRTLYLHGTPQLYIPSVISIAPQEGQSPDSEMDLNYAATQVWSNELLKMRDLAHVMQSGEVITYNWDSTRLFLMNPDKESGTEVTKAQVVKYDPKNPGSGNYVIAVPIGKNADGVDIMYDVAPLGGDHATAMKRTANVFIKAKQNADNQDVLKNTPGTYRMTMVFRDNIDGMGTDGAVGAWDANWGALYKENGNGYVETEIKVLVTGKDNRPVMPDQAVLRPNFIATDSVWFEELKAYRNIPLQTITDSTTEADKALAADIAANRVLRLDNGEGIVLYYKAIEKPENPPEDAPDEAITSLMKLFTQAMRFRIHDVDVQAIKPKDDSGELKLDQYKEIHDAAVAMLWGSTVVTQLEAPSFTKQGNEVFKDPTSANLLKVIESVRNSPKQAATIEMTLQVGNIVITPDSTSADDEDISDGKYIKHGYKLELKRDETVKETYKFYIHSPMAFERPGNLPMVTYGLHTPTEDEHTAMNLNTYYTSAYALQKNVFEISSPTVDIRFADQSVKMDYISTHTIKGLLPTLRESTSHYLGRAFVNGKVELVRTGGIPLFVRGEAGVAVDITEGYTAKLNKWIKLPADNDPAKMGKEYPKVKTEDGEGAEFAENQPANLKIYDSTNLYEPIFNSDAKGTQSSKTYTNTLPGVRTMVYVAEDLPTDAAHPYHNGANRKELRVDYIFDGPVTLRFGGNVQGAVGGYSLTVLNTVTDAELKALLGAYGTVVYGERPTVTEDLAANVVIVRDAGKLPTSVAVSVSDKNGRKVSQTVGLTVQEPPVLRIQLLDENDREIADVSIPDIEDIVIGRSYTAFAPQVDGYLLNGNPTQTIAAIAAGINTLKFKYTKVAPGQVITEYTVKYMAKGDTLFEGTYAGVVGKSVKHTANTEFYVRDVRYVLTAAETINPKTLLLSAEAPNEITFEYEMRALPASVAYSTEYTYNGVAVESTTALGTVGQDATFTAPEKFTKGVFEYTLKPDETNPRTHILGANAADNVERFAYDRTAVSGGGGGGGSVTVNYYSVLYLAKPYGKLTGEGTLQVKSGDKPSSVPVVVPNEGYTFLGWYTDDIAKLVDPSGVGVTAATVFRAAFRAPDDTTVGADGGDPRPIPELELSDHGAYMMGDANGNFRSDASITRAEVVVLFSRLLKEKMPTGVALSSKFSDVVPGRWYTNTVAYMEQFGIIMGYGDGTFRPSEPITRSEFVAIASRFSQLELTDRQSFPDVPADNWAAVYINSAKHKGWITGYEDGTFRPNRTIARAEAVKIVNALLGRSFDKVYIGDHASELTSFPDLDPSHWAYGEIMEATNAHDHIGSTERWTKIR